MSQTTTAPTEEQKIEVLSSPLAPPAGLLTNQTRCSLRLKNSLVWTTVTPAAAIVITCVSRRHMLAANVTYARVLAELASAAVLMFSSVISIAAQFFAPPKPRAMIHAVSLFATIAAMCGSLLAVGLVWIDFGYAWRDAPCVERAPENWGVFAMCVLHGSADIVLAGTAATAVRPLLAMTRSSDGDIASSDEERSLDMKPEAHARHTAMVIISGIITVCFTPTCCHSHLKETSLAERHIVFHVIQLVYEVILLIVACIKSSWVNVVAIGAGLLASGISSAATFFPRAIFHAVRVDILLNSFALACTLFTFPMEISLLTCGTYSRSGLEMAVYIIAFALGADIIRANSILHSSVEHATARWAWLQLHTRGHLPDEFLIEAHEKTLLLTGSEDHKRPSPPNIDEKQKAFLRTRKPLRNLIIFSVITVALIVATVTVGCTALASSAAATKHSESVNAIVVRVVSKQLCKIEKNETGWEWRLELWAAIHSGENVTGTITSHCTPTWYTYDPGDHVWVYWCSNGLSWNRPTISIAALLSVTLLGSGALIFLVFVAITIEYYVKSTQLRKYEQQQQPTNS